MYFCPFVKAAVVGEVVLLRHTELHIKTDFLHPQWDHCEQH